MGVLSALPLVNVFNVCCCGWVICGGVVAAYVLQQNTATMITPGDGALVGLLAGLIGAFIAVFVSIPLDILVGPMERAFAQRIVDMAGTMPPEMRDFLDRYSRGGAAGRDRHPAGLLSCTPLHTAAPPLTFFVLRSEIS